LEPARERERERERGGGVVWVVGVRGRETKREEGEEIE
jgi:hypothetical protein